MAVAEAMRVNQVPRQHMRGLLRHPQPGQGVLDQVARDQETVNQRKVLHWYFSLLIFIAHNHIVIYACR